MRCDVAVFGMHAHSECEVVRLRASPAKRGVQPWLRCTRVTFVSMCAASKRVYMESGRAPICHLPGLVRCLAALAEVQALSAFLVLHAEPQSCARAGERRTVAFHFNGAMLATMYLCYGRHGERGRRRRGL